MLKCMCVRILGVAKWGEDTATATWQIRNIAGEWQQTRLLAHVPRVNHSIYEHVVTSLYEQPCSTMAS